MQWKYLLSYYVLYLQILHTDDSKQPGILFIPIMGRAKTSFVHFYRNLNFDIKHSGQFGNNISYLQPSLYSNVIQTLNGQQNLSLIQSMKNVLAI